LNRRAGEKPVWVGPEEGRMGRGNDDWLDQLTVFNYTKRASAVLHSKKKTYQKVKQVMSPLFYFWYHRF
jgi:hypothetical protein